MFIQRIPYTFLLMADYLALEFLRNLNGYFDTIFLGSFCIVISFLCGACSLELKYLSVQ